jgi:hypothetical protein
MKCDAVQRVVGVFRETLFIIYKVFQYSQDVRAIPGVTLA